MGLVELLDRRAPRLVLSVGHDDVEGDRRREDCSARCGEPMSLTAYVLYSL
jgi:hypothetical protein